MCMKKMFDNNSRQSQFNLTTHNSKQKHSGLNMIQKRKTSNKHNFSCSSKKTETQNKYQKDGQTYISQLSIKPITYF